MVTMQLFELFGINRAALGARIFGLLVNLLVEGESMKDAVELVCAVYEIPRAAAYALAKRALAPVFAEPEKMSSYGMRPAQTVSDLARQVAAYTLLLRDDLIGYVK